MTGTPELNRFEPHRNIQEPALVRWILIAVAMLFLCLFLFLPLATVFVNAFSQGIRSYWQAVSDPETLGVVRLTMTTVGLAVPINILFGIACAWAVAKFDFRGKNLLITLIDLPFTVSPVIGGAIFVLLLGARSWLGGWLSEHNIKIIFAYPGIVLATLFVTFPFVARELIPLMQAHGTDEEEAAIVLGANGWQTFFRITLPNIRWGLIYGIILSTARAMGEFGAVSVVSGHVRGQTITMPLQVEILYNEYNFMGAFSVASLLTVIGIGTLVSKRIAMWQSRRVARMQALATEEITHGH